MRIIIKTVLDRKVLVLLQGQRSGQIFSVTELIVPCFYLYVIQERAQVTKTGTNQLPLKKKKKKKRHFSSKALEFRRFKFFIVWFKVMSYFIRFLT